MRLYKFLFPFALLTFFGCKAVQNNFAKSDSLEAAAKKIEDSSARSSCEHLRLLYRCASCSSLVVYISDAHLYLFQ